MIHPFSIWYYSISVINFLVSASVTVFTLNQCGWKKKKKKKGNRHTSTQNWKILTFVLKGTKNINS